MTRVAAASVLAAYPAPLFLSYLSLMVCSSFRIVNLHHLFPVPIYWVLVLSNCLYLPLIPFPLLHHAFSLTPHSLLRGFSRSCMVRSIRTHYRNTYLRVTYLCTIGRTGLVVIKPMRRLAVRIMSVSSYGLAWGVWRARIVRQRIPFSSKSVVVVVISFTVLLENCNFPLEVLSIPCFP